MKINGKSVIAGFECGGQSALLKIDQQPKPDDTYTDDMDKDWKVKSVQSQDDGYLIRYW